jgi:MFS family permease
MAKSGRYMSWGDWFFQPEALFILLTAVNLLNYIDRGIIPGSTNEFNKFILNTVDTTKPDIFLGLLQSAFIVGFSLSSIVFGHAVHFFPPFFLCGCGLSIWIVAVICSGLSYYFDSYTFLLLSRALSGCGEASFQCSVPPWIQATAGEGSKAKWISLFYTAIPVGTAMGYVFSSAVSSTLGWQWAFFLEAFMMAPFVFYLFAASPRYPTLTGVSGVEDNAGASNNLNQDLLSPEEKKNMAAGGGGGQSATATPVDEEAHNAPTIWAELKAIFSRPIYVCIVMGYAAQTGALIGISTFGSAFLMGLGFFDTEMEASSCFGVLVSLSGIIGTLLGGFLLDKSIESHANSLQKEREDDERQSLTEGDIPPGQEMGRREKELVQVKAATSMIFLTSIIGAVLMWCVFFVQAKVLFLAVIGAGCALLFLATPGINIGAMNAVPVQNRAFCMAMMSVCIHALGDVPSPILAGMIKDDLAPGCNGVDAASDPCREDSEGLRQTMLIVCSWFLWCIVFFGLARFISSLSAKWRNDLEEDDKDEGGGSGKVDTEVGGGAKAGALHKRQAQGKSGSGEGGSKNPMRGSSDDDLAGRDNSFSF